MLGFSGIAQRFFGSANERKLRPFSARVAEINALEPKYAAMTDAQLRAAQVPVYAEPPDLTVSRTSAYNAKTAHVVYVLGRRTTFANTTPFQDIGQYLVGGVSAFNAAAVGTTYYLVSTSANDVNGNTGADTVRIVYLDNNGAQQVTTKTLNGTTPVNIGAGYAYIQWMEVAAVGSNGTAVGDITIDSTKSGSVKIKPAIKRRR